MSEWFFVDLPSNTIAGLPEPQFPYPIRRGSMAVYEHQKEEGLPLLLIADELDVYLEEHPARIERYRGEAAHLFLCAGVQTAPAPATKTMPSPSRRWRMKLSTSLRGQFLFLVDGIAAFLGGR